jgi:2-polyprenyl-6-hydroxyphenyl methylase/3-demethylubiquinone-9 3-methyltransferase
MKKMTDDYYKKKLSANALRKCYALANKRIQQYLDAEIEFILEKINPRDIVLELGCGYGRVINKIAKYCKRVYGIDTSQDSLDYAKKYLKGISNVELINMNAGELVFRRNFFDIVIAIQNGISAFKIKPQRLVNECLRVTKEKGIILLSSYSDAIWKERLEWFLKQAEYGLLGEIDLQKSKNGTIVGKDGFQATTFSVNDFEKLITNMNLSAEIKIIDNSSIFCIITK